MSRSEEREHAEVVVSRGDWEGFLSSLERLMSLHQRTLQRLKDLRIRNEALRTELRSALVLPTVKARETTGEGIGRPTVLALVGVKRCLHCDREIEISAKFCDRCGRTIAVSVCECGRELGGSAKFCDICGRSVTGS